MHRGIGSRGLRGEMPHLYLLDDAVELGVHVGVLRRVGLVFNGRKVLVAEVAGLLWGSFGCGCAAGLCRGGTRIRYHGEHQRHS